MKAHTERERETAEAEVEEGKEEVKPLSKYLTKRKIAAFFFYLHI